MSEDKNKPLFLQLGAALVFMGICILSRDWPWPKFNLPMAIAAFCGAVWMHGEHLRHLRSEPAGKETE